MVQAQGAARLGVSRQEASSVLPASSRHLGPPRWSQRLAGATTTPAPDPGGTAKPWAGSNHTTQVPACCGHHPGMGWSPARHPGHTAGLQPSAAAPQGYRAPSPCTLSCLHSSSDRKKCLQPTGPTAASPVPPGQAAYLAACVACSWSSGLFPFTASTISSKDS